MCERQHDDLTRLLAEAAAGDDRALQAAFAAVEGELRKLAHARRRRLWPGDDLSTTMIIDQVYCNLMKAGGGWADCRRFYACAAVAIRNLVVSHIRSQAIRKPRDGSIVGLPEEGDDDGVLIDRKTPLDVPTLLAIHEALERLGAVPGGTEALTVVQLRIYARMSEREVAERLGVKRDKVRHWWDVARAFLYRELEGLPFLSGGLKGELR
jgi:DNA-directed RNA polymerase specialized sigma24 family protein